MARTHAKTYTQRNALARAQGFSSYYEKRKAMRSMNDDAWFKRQVNRYRERHGEGKREKFTARTKEARDLALKRQRALATKTTNHEVGGARYELFVEDLGIMDEDEWIELYG